MRKAMIIFLLINFSICSMAKETLHIATKNDPADFAIYTSNEAPPPLGENDQETTMSGHQVYCAMWNNGKVIMGSDHKPTGPYWEFQLSPTMIQSLITDGITSASQINQTSANLPGHIEVVALWPYDHPTARRKSISGSMSEFFKLELENSDSVSTQSAELYSLVNSVLDRLPPAESGTKRDIKWKY